MDPTATNADPFAGFPNHSLAEVPSPSPRRRGRLGWLGHLTFLTAWIAFLIVGGYIQQTGGRVPHPLANVPGLLSRLAINALVFGVVCGLAWLCSRATATEWRLRWRGGLGPIWRGLLYSVAVRIATFVITFAVVFPLLLARVIDAHTVEKFKPQTEHLLSFYALVHDRPFYWCMVTLLCGSAGILEETWRGGMLAGLAGAFPRVFGGPVGSWAAILPVSILFGLAHLYMGWAAVGGTTLIGVVLGAIMVCHRTIWDAVVAHALFDSSSIIVLAWGAEHYPKSFGL